jgi:hypothetical protein
MISTVSLMYSLLLSESESLLVSIQDVAVKVLTVQDFHGDQLREFLREVCTG